MDGELAIMLLTVGLAGLAAVTAVVLVLVLSRRFARSQTIESMSRAEATRPSKVVCPLCGTSMAPGYAVCSRGLFWYPRGVGISQSGIMWKALPNTLNMGMRVRANRAWHCEGCRVMTIDHSRLVEQG